MTAETQKGPTIIRRHWMIVGLFCRASFFDFILFSNLKLRFVTGRKALELLPFRANIKFFLILFLSRKSITRQTSPNKIKNLAHRRGGTVTNEVPFFVASQFSLLSFLF